MDASTEGYFGRGGPQYGDCMRVMVQASEGSDGWTMDEGVRRAEQVPRPI